MDGGGQRGRGLSFLEIGPTEKEKVKKWPLRRPLTHKLIKESEKSLSDSRPTHLQEGSGCGREMRNVFAED